MANVFIAFYNGLRDENNINIMPVFYESFIYGLKSQGNNVMVYHHRLWNKDFEKVPEELLKIIKDFNPTVCFIFNNSFYDLADDLDCPIVIYEVDSPLYYANKEKIKSNPNRYLYFIASSDNKQYLQELFGVLPNRIFRTPFFTSINPENMEQNNNIVFIGSKFTSNNINTSINKFISTAPTNDEKIMFKKCIEYIKNNPYVTKEELISKLNIKSHKISSNLDIHELVFLLSDEQRIGVLSNISDLGLELYGTKNWGTNYFYNSNLNLCYNKKNIYSLKHNQDIYNSTKIGISISHLQAKSGFPWRVCDVMASNACLVSDYHSDFDIFFPGIEIPVFESPQEARELCLSLLKDNNKRKEIVLSCQEYVKKNYSFDRLLKIIEEILSCTLHTDETGMISWLSDNEKRQI